MNLHIYGIMINVLTDCKRGWLSVVLPVFVLQITGVIGYQIQNDLFSVSLNHISCSHDGGICMFIFMFYSSVSQPVLLKPLYSAVHRQKLRRRLHN